MTFGASRQERRAMNRQLQKRNLEWPVTLTDVPREQWPPFKEQPIRVMRNREFLVQIFQLSDTVRLSANRTSLRADGRWEDGITWDQLQALKAEAGYGHRWAIEIFPPDADVVNDANIRHLWLVDQPPFAWLRR